MLSITLCESATVGRLCICDDRVLRLRELTNRISLTYSNVILWINIWETAMKIMGIGICFVIMLGAILQFGCGLFFGMCAALFVLGGATGFLIIKKNSGNHARDFGQGAVYFGCLGTLILEIGVGEGRKFYSGD